MEDIQWSIISANPNLALRIKRFSLHLTYPTPVMPVGSSRVGGIIVDGLSYKVSASEENRPGANTLGLRAVRSRHDLKIYASLGIKTYFRPTKP